VSPFAAYLAESGAVSEEELGELERAVERLRSARGEGKRSVAGGRRSKKEA
jgi:hypothetical protein